MILAAILTRRELALITQDLFPPTPEEPATTPQRMLPVYKALTKVGIGFTGCSDLETLSGV